MENELKFKIVGLSNDQCVKIYDKDDNEVTAALKICKKMRRAREITLKPVQGNPGPVLIKFEDVYSRNVFDDPPKGPVVLEPSNLEGETLYLRNDLGLKNEDCAFQKEDDEHQYKIKYSVTPKACDNHITHATVIIEC